MKLSIIVPVYNVEKYLRKCIDSILQQEYADFELILVDDGSRDNSPQICDDYAVQDKRVRVIHKENGGANSAVIAGVKASCGEYLAFVDSDDWIEPEMYSEMMRFVDKHNLDCVICNYNYVYENSDKISQVDFGLDEGLYANETLQTFYEHLIPDLITGKYLAGSRCNKVFLREKLYDILVNSDACITIAEDTMVTHQALLQSESIYFTKKAYYNYYKNTASVMGRYKENYFNDWKVTTSIYDGYREKFTKYKAIEQAKFALFIFNVFSFILRSNITFKQKRKYLKKILKDEYVKKVIADVKDVDKAGYYKKIYFILKHKLVLPLMIYKQIKQYI